MSARPRLSLWLGAGLLLLHGLPLLAPPGPRALLAPGAAAGLFERVFPDVPLLWVGLRLCALALGCVLVARHLPQPQLPAAAPPVGEPGRGWLALAGLLATLQAGVALAAGSLERGSQIAFFFTLPLPAILVALGTRGDSAATSRHSHRRDIAAVAGVLMAFLLLRLPASINAVRGASATDGFIHLQWIARAAYADINYLTDSTLPGAATNYFLLFGLPLLGEGGIPPNLPFMQLGIALWACITAGLLAALANAMIGRSAAPLVAAVFLFSPWIMTLPIAVLPLTGMIALTAALGLLLHRAVARGSAAALVAMGPVAGVAANQAQVAPVAALAVLVLGVWFLRGGRRALPLVAWAACGLGCFAAAWPGLPDPSEIFTFSQRYVGLQGEYATLQEAIYGQVKPYPAIWEAWRMERAGVLDVPVGALLSPFAVARTPLRLWGDALWDPLGGLLLAIGLATCVQAARRGRPGRVALALLGFLLLPGLTSSFDRPSHTRMIASCVPLALLAGLGFERIRQGIAAHGPPARFTFAACGLVMLGGVWLFDVVNPRILQASYLEVGIEALGRAGPDGDVVALSHAGDRDLGWFHLESITEVLPRNRWQVSPYFGPESVEKFASGRAPDFFLWSPGLEEEVPVSRGLCLHWPDARLYVLSDRTGLSRVFAARVSGERTPQLPAARLRALGCSEIDVFGLQGS